MKTLVLAILLTGTCAYGQDVAMVEPLSVYGNSLPDAPKPNLKPTRTDHIIWMANAGANLTDFILTEKCIKLPYQQCHEGVLPGFIWKHPAAFLGFEAARSYGQIAIGQELRKHHHSKYARAWDVTNLVTSVEIDLYVNDLIQGKPATKANLRRIP
jgi:hypothetical protein